MLRCGVNVQNADVVRWHKQTFYFSFLPFMDDLFYFHILLRHVTLFEGLIKLFRAKYSDKINFLLLDGKMSRIFRSTTTNAAGIITQIEQQNNNKTTINEETKSNIERVDLPPIQKKKKKNPTTPQKIWLQFVGNSLHLGRHGTQEMQVNVNVRLKCYMERYASGIGKSRQYLRFLSPDGVRMEADKSAQKYGLEDGDQIDVFEWQVGGNNQ